MKIDIVTLFPGFFNEPLQTSIVGRAQQASKVGIAVHDLRRYAEDRHGSVDDTPYGGGGGMVMKPKPLTRCWEALELSRGLCVYLTADGERLDQNLAIQLSLQSHLVLLCGHYKGIDERVRETLIDREISIGDYVLTGGEPASLVLIDALVRLIPGVLGDFSSAMADSFHDDGLLDCPWYTRPAEFANRAVPEVLLQGDHGTVAVWRRRQALRRTFERRPELLATADLDEEERNLIAAWEAESS
ncbi:MAG: tRNA (guanosine(37)-N1)-methyltransferase TrmD [Candidatus Latescibacterota bacterium]|nr:tRNA (guanosine(37)-N1)-methyltransferase TrmD [Candidatus Latescibacterota bacterium]